MPELPAAAGLFLVPIVDIRISPNRLAICDLRQRRPEVHIELPGDSLDRDLHVNVAEAVKDCLGSLCVPLNS